MADIFDKGTHVRWKWGDGYGEGKVVESYTSKITKQIDGADVTRNADDDNPAYLIEQEDGDRVLKSHSEIRLAD